MHMQNSIIEEMMPFDSMMKMLKTEIFKLLCTEHKENRKVDLPFHRKISQGILKKSNLLQYLIFEMISFHMKYSYFHKNVYD